MKFYKTVIPALLAAFLCTACDKEVPQLAQANTDFSNAATMQVFNATLRSARNFVYVDGTVLSGSLLGYGGVFPATAYAAKVSSGSRTILIRDTAATSTQPAITLSQNFDAGKSYTLFLYDTVATPKGIAVANNIVVPADTTARLRFANFVYNPTAVANVDVYSFRRGGVNGTAAAAIFSNVATASVTGFIPYASGTTDTLYVYATGTTTPLLYKGFVTSLTPTRSYTSVYNGSYRTPTSTAKAISTFITY
jgi:hypothetical protein